MIAKINRPNRGVIEVGAGRLTRVAGLIGASNETQYEGQKRKIDALLAMEAGPDLIFDLSVNVLSSPLWKYITECGIAAATVPIYSVRRSSDQVDEQELLDRITEQVEGGVGVITIHVTPCWEIIKHARHRIVPWTSRGGGIVIRDLVRRGGAQNIYNKIMKNVVSLAIKHNTIISIGTSFRSSNIFDACDIAHDTEIKLQIKIALELIAQGCQVIIESPGHARPRDIIKIARRLSKTRIPVMPLGPMPTDASIGQDHVSAAIGATIMGMSGAAHILCAVTRDEHTGGIPSIDSTVEAIRAARVAAHVIDIHRLGDTQDDRKIVEKRAAKRSCIAASEFRGCERCGNICPL